MSLLGKTIFPLLSMCMQVSMLISNSLPSLNLPWRVPFDSQSKKTERELRYILTKRGESLYEDYSNAVSLSKFNKIATFNFVSLGSLLRLLMKIFITVVESLGK